MKAAADAATAVSSSPSGAVGVVPGHHQGAGLPSEVLTTLALGEPWPLPDGHVVVTAWAPAKQVGEVQGQSLNPDPGHLQAFLEITMLLLRSGTFKVLL